MSTVPNKKGTGKKSPRAASTKKPTDPRIVVRFEDRPNTGTASAPLGVRPVLVGGYDIHQAADRYKVPVPDLWRMWRAVWGHCYPEMPWPAGYNSPQLVQMCLDCHVQQMQHMAFTVSRTLADLDEVQTVGGKAGGK